MVETKWKDKRKETQQSCGGAELGSPLLAVEFRREETRGLRAWFYGWLVLRCFDPKKLESEVTMTRIDRFTFCFLGYKNLTLKGIVKTEKIGTDESTAEV